MTDKIETHEMKMVISNDASGQIFICPICDRKIKLTHDDFNVLVRGNDTVHHTGSSGGITMGVTANIDELNELFKDDR